MKYVMIALALCLSGCTLFQENSGTRRVFDMAEGTAETAKASLELHNAVGEWMAGMIENRAVSEATKSEVRRLYRPTVCSKDEIDIGTKTEECDDGPSYQADKAIKAFEAVQNAQTAEELRVATNAFVPLLVDLTTATLGR